MALDLGCGRGERTAAYDDEGRIHWVGIDINAGALRFARVHTVDRAFVRGDIEHLPFCESSFDAIFSFSVLQYVDWESAIARYRRLLRSGGRAVFVENLCANPIAAVYRRLHRLVGWKYSPAQSPKRHLKWKDLDTFRAVFGNAEISTCHLTTPAALIIPTLWNRMTGNPVRVRPRWLLRTLTYLDRLLLGGMPFLARFCWMVVICVTKPNRQTTCPGNGFPSLGTAHAVSFCDRKSIREV